MKIPTVKPARTRFHSPELECDVSRRIGWYVQHPEGVRGKIHRTRDEARAEARGGDERGDVPHS